MDLKELDNVDPHTHWYYQAKSAGIKRQLRRLHAPVDQLIDVGSGSGFFAETALANGSAISAICIDPNYADEQLKTNGQVTYVRHVDPASISTTGLFLFIDVLEHVNDDRGLLCEYLRSAPAGALVVITVPAFQSLWSDHDEFLGHFRRYRLAQVEQLIRGVGLEILDARYLFSSIFPAVWVRRHMPRRRPPQSDMRSTPTLLNRLLSAILTFEHVTTTNTKFGLSAMVTARVPVKQR